MEPGTFSDIPLFDGLSRVELLAVGTHAVHRQVARGTVLLREGEPPHTLYIVRSGRFRVSVADEAGKALVLGHLGAGQWFGELALIDGAPRSATVVATEDAQVQVVSKAAFLRCLSERPGIAVKLLRDLVRRVRSLNDSVRDFALLDVQGRVCRVLERLTRESGGDGKCTAPVTHQEIADMVGASRERVSRVLGRLRAQGAIEVSAKRITLKSSQAGRRGRDTGARQAQYSRRPVPGQKIDQKA